MSFRFALMASHLLWLSAVPTLAADPEVLRPRVPADQLQAVRAVMNPFSPTPDIIGKGKILFEG